SADPLGFAGGDVNLYRYVANNPLVRVDPSGLWTSCKPGNVARYTNWVNLPAAGEMLGSFGPVLPSINPLPIGIGPAEFLLCRRARGVIRFYHCTKSYCGFAPYSWIDTRLDGVETQCARMNVLGTAACFVMFTNIVI